jgi:hypothetical protein
VIVRARASGAALAARLHRKRHPNSCCSLRPGHRQEDRGAHPAAFSALYCSEWTELRHELPAELASRTIYWPGLKMLSRSSSIQRHDVGARIRGRLRPMGGDSPGPEGGRTRQLLPAPRGPDRAGEEQHGSRPGLRRSHRHRNQRSPRSYHTTIPQRPSVQAGVRGRGPEYRALPDGFNERW